MNGKNMVFSSLILLASTLQAAPKFMNVQIRTGQLRSKASFLGKVIQEIAYGTQMEILQAKGDWMQVKLKSRTGWMHKSALTTKRIVMTSGIASGKTGASSDELALAGKGFSSEVEKEYKGQNRKLNFAFVDSMEKIKVTSGDIQNFLISGNVQPLEGGE